MYDVDRENNLRRALAEASEADLRVLDTMMAVYVDRFARGGRPLPPEAVSIRLSIEAGVIRVEREQDSVERGSPEWGAGPTADWSEPPTDIDRLGVGK